MLVALALSGPEEALWWLLSKLFRYSFCGICRNKLESLALIAQGKKNHFFLTGQPSTTSFAFTYTSVVALRRDILAVVRLFMTHCFYSSQDYTQACA